MWVLDASNQFIELKVCKYRDLSSHQTKLSCPQEIVQKFKISLTSSYYAIVSSNILYDRFETIAMQDEQQQ